MANLSIVVIESDDFLRNTICSQLEETEGMQVSGSVEDPAAGQRIAAQQSPDVLILEVPAQRPEEALALAEWMRIEHPVAVVLGAASTAEQELLRGAMRAGIQDLLARPIDPGQLALALEHALTQKARRLRAQERRGEIVAVFGVGGGVGTTTIATNTAVGLERRSDAPVALVDLDLSMGSIPCFLDMNATPGYQSVVEGLGRMDGEGLRQLLPRHTSGVYVLAGPPAIEDLEAVRAADVAEVLELCRQGFRHVIVDAGHGFDDRRTEVLDHADQILLVTQLHVAAMHATRKTADTLHRLGYTEEQIKIVVNRNGRSQVTIEDVEQSLGQPVSFTIPNDFPTAINAIDSGIPIVTSKRRGKTVKSFEQLANALLPAESSNGANGKKRGKEAASGAGTRKPRRSPFTRLQQLLGMRSDALERA